MKILSTHSFFCSSAWFTCKWNNLQQLERLCWAICPRKWNPTHLNPMPFIGLSPRPVSFLRSSHQVVEFGQSILCLDGMKEGAISLLGMLLDVILHEVAGLQVTKFYETGHVQGIMIWKQSIKLYTEKVHVIQVEWDNFRGCESQELMVRFLQRCQKDIPAKAFPSFILKGDQDIK
ncbi:hypothetical protein TNIN_495541 [Trichonephila inaurata madagascariensis]|uniref:Uncharacterized protein n=1 Tax=Trichonephila inaurata madagascariensis TaxID=2747483 RepID=A0A8X7BWH2_9ARAC|nr:hypothetical protein TNIN_495541 [Trichonephila inaurata madagascariensis]